MSVSLDIGGLVLDGFDAGDADRVAGRLQAVLEAGLQRADLGSVDLPDVVLDGVDFSTPERLGETLGAAILTRIGV